MLLVAGGVAAPAEAAAAAVPPAPDPPAPDSISAFGAASSYGPEGGLHLNAPLIDLVATPSGDGYWLVAGDGGVFSFGDAVFRGSTGNLRLNQPVVGMASTGTGNGYWFVAGDGGVFSFGDAVFLGSMGAVRLNQPIVAMAATSTGDGYWLAAADGGVFTFGDARFLGSEGGQDLDAPIVDIAPTASGHGYWLVAADGGVFSFGDAEFHGSLGGHQLPAPVVGAGASPTGNGYWLVARNGEVFPFGVTDHGGAAAADVQPPTVGIAAHPSRSGYWLVHGEDLVTQIEDEGPAVRRLQRRLQNLGYWLGNIDGVYGSLTEQAVYAFQKYEGLPLDGSIEADDDRALDAAVPPHARSTDSDHVEIDETRQLLFVVSDGRTRWVLNTSTGSEEPYTHEGAEYGADTPNGDFTVTRQIDGWRESSLGRLYRPKYFHERGIAVHGSTFVPPYAASHGCVRISIPGMDFLWDQDLLPVGSNVEVYGSPVHRGG